MCIMSFFNSNIVSAITGGLLGGAFTIWAVDKTIRNENEKTRSHEEQEVRSFCKAIQSELVCILKRYMFNYINR